MPRTVPRPHHRRLRLLADLEGLGGGPPGFRRLALDGDPFDRHRFAPGHATASGIVLTRRLDAVLLVEHRRLGRWLQPGGHVDPDDVDAEAAARREIAEETGVVDLELLAAGPVDADVHHVPARDDEPAHLHFDLRYAYFADRVDPRPKADETHAVRWASLDELARFGVDAGLRRAIDAALAAAKGPDPEQGDPRAV
ncbi:MAG TPA: NUDIX domain-containing protein [Actinobacteria bacterium]|nr:NUDIX domain-containing protein [Actinomycetota bacterium]